MRLPRFRLRTVILAIAIVALVLAGWKVVDDGPRTHWLLLKLRFGGVEARRSASDEIWESVRNGAFQDLFGGVFGTAPGPQLLAQHRHLWQRRAELIIPALIDAARDPDPGCRARALKALYAMVAFHGSDLQKNQALPLFLTATRDRDDAVRTAAVGSLSGLADRDLETVLETFRSVLADPSLEVRQMAIWELGMLGILHPATQPDVAPILTGILVSRRDPRERIKAAQILSVMGVDRRRHPPGTGPDVVPALVAALRDPELEVRREAARVLGHTTLDAQARLISAWDSRRDAIIPALDAALAHDDVVMRQEAALALFGFGRREGVVLGLIEAAALDPSRKARSESAIEELRTEREEATPAPNPREEGP
jgi:HEAT repeat protein